MAFYGDGTRVTINLYDSFGRLVKNVFQGITPKGKHIIEVNAATASLPSGVYRISIFSDGQATQTIGLLKE